MKVVHINLSDSDGGAAKATLRLHNAMKSQGIDSKVFVIRHLLKQDPTIFSTSILDREIFSKMRYLIGHFKVRNSNKKRGLFSYPICGINLSNRKIIREADFIYLHWINHGLLDLKGIEKLLNLNKPVIWIAHDMWPATGGCHHALECANYKTECHNCPSLLGDVNKDLSFRQFNSKQKLYSKYNNLYFIAISDFMKGILKGSALTKDTPIEPITNALDTSVFNRIDRVFSCQALGLDPAKKYILFGADLGVKNRYKGWDYFKIAMDKLYSKYSDSVEVVIFGSSYSAEAESVIPFKTHFLGKIHDELTMKIIYNAADVFVVSSIAESLSYTTVESISCGTPVAGFDVGGIPYIVKHKINGYLAENGNSDDLAKAVEWILSIENLEEFKRSCRESIVSRFDSEVVAKQHIAFMNRF